MLTDKSSNGTLINNRHIEKDTPYTLQPDDLVSLAQVTQV
jgi:hypothetical protein